MINNLIRFFWVLSLVTFVACRCSTEFLPKDDNLGDSTIQATAHMWQGQYEYLGIDILIKRTDSLFVKDVQVIPEIDNHSFPEFIQYEMYSYYFESEGQSKGGPYWETFSAKRFDQLPEVNRQTNLGEQCVRYTAFYQSEKHINFEEFSAEIVVTLTDTSRKEIIHKRRIDFYGKRNCRFSTH